MAAATTTAVGGKGASSARLVGHDNFKRHNPMSDRFDVLDFDHVELWCDDATNSFGRFASAMGLSLVATMDIDSGCTLFTSKVGRSGTILFAFTAPYWTEAPPGAKVAPTIFPQYNKDEALAFVKRHGSPAVRAIGFQVGDAAAAFQQCVANGGRGILPPTKLTDEHGTIVYCEVAVYDDVVYRYVEGRKQFKGQFLPGYANLPNTERSYGLYRIDHIVSNVPNLLEVTDHVMRMTGFHEFSEFTAEDVGTVDSGLNSMVLANNRQTVLLPVNEPTFGTRRKSQIQSFLEHHQGPGVQHIALHTHDIIATIEKMVAVPGGFDFMGSPGDAYYDIHVPKKMGNLIPSELVAACRRYNILIDRDDEGTLLQIFTKPLLDRPTLFIEIIQRVGCIQPDGAQKPACGGFGKGNFGALFKSIEDYEKKRDGE